MPNLTKIVTIFVDKATGDWLTNLLESDELSVEIMILVYLVLSLCKAKVFPKCKRVMILTTFATSITPAFMTYIRLLFLAI